MRDYTTREQRLKIPDYKPKGTKLDFITGFLLFTFTYFVAGLIVNLL